jgi:hypothetical protein
MAEGLGKEAERKLSVPGPSTSCAGVPRFPKPLSSQAELLPPDRGAFGVAALLDLALGGLRGSIEADLLGAQGHPLAPMKLSKGAASWGLHSRCSGSCLYSWECPGRCLSYRFGCFFFFLELPFAFGKEDLRAQPWVSPRAGTGIWPCGSAVLLPLVEQSGSLDPCSTQRGPEVSSVLQLLKPGQLRARPGEFGEASSVTGPWGGRDLKEKGWGSCHWSSLILLTKWGTWGSWGGGTDGVSRRQLEYNHPPPY